MFRTPRVQVRAILMIMFFVFDPVVVVVDDVAVVAVVIVVVLHCIKLGCLLYSILTRVLMRLTKVMVL